MTRIFIEKVVFALFADTTFFDFDAVLHMPLVVVDS